MEKLPLILSIVAIVLSIIGIFGCVILFFIGRNEEESVNKSENDFREQVIKIVKESNRIKVFFNALAERQFNSLARNLLQTNRNADAQRTIDEKQKKEIENDVIKLLEPIVQKMISENRVEINEVKSSQNSIEAAVLRKYGFFRKDSFAVDDNPKESSIFVFDIDSHDSSKASFDVFDEQKEKAIEDKNYLEGCCSIEGDGKRMQTISKGRALFRDGIWIVDKKLNIRFS